MADDEKYILRSQVRTDTRGWSIANAIVELLLPALCSFRSLRPMASFGGKASKGLAENKNEGRRWNGLERRWEIFKRLETS